MIVQETESIHSALISFVTNAQRCSKSFVLPVGRATISFASLHGEHVIQAHAAVENLLTRPPLGFKASVEAGSVVDLEGSVRFIAPVR
jgi:hypothetical protein